MKNSVRNGFKRSSSKERNSIYIALEETKDSDWFWSLSEVNKFDRLWNLNMSIEGIAEQLGRSKASVFILSIDRTLKRKVKMRDWDIW